MSDDFDDKVKLIYNSLERRGISRKCPICTSENWISFETTKDNSIVVYLEIGNEDSKRRFPAVMFTCTNCGFIKHHATLPLEIIENADGREESDGEAVT